MTTLTQTSDTQLAPVERKELTLAEELQILAVKLDAEYAAQEALEDKPLDEWLPSWYLGQQASIDALREQIKQQVEVMMRHLMTQEKALKWKWGAQFQVIVDQKLADQKGKKKSVDFLTGKAGYRTKPAKITIIDRAAVKAWCEEHCLDALELIVQRTTPIKEHIESTGEVPPGIEHTPKHDAFFPALLHPSLEEELRAALPEGDTP